MFWFHPLVLRASFPITNTMSAMSNKKDGGRQQTIGHHGNQKNQSSESRSTSLKDAAARTLEGVKSRKRAKDRRRRSTPTPRPTPTAKPSRSSSESSATSEMSVSSEKSWTKSFCAMKRLLAPQTTRRNKSKIETVLRTGEKKTQFSRLRSERRSERRGAQWSTVWICQCPSLRRRDV